MRIGPRLGRLGIALCSIAAMALVGVTPSLEAYGAERPFPKYDLSFEWIHGTVDSNWKPGDPGDGCVRVANPEVTHLTTFGFSTVINPCDGVRTTMTFYYDDPAVVTAPTLDFRWGVTWQYKDRAKPGDWIWKPVENMTFDGVPVSAETIDLNDQNDVVVKKADGTFRRVSDRPGNFFEPRHVVFDEEFSVSDRHSFVWDAYLPKNSDEAGMSIGTGSTGDTQGGSIGAKANGLYVSIPAYADYRYVLDSEYRAATGLTDPTAKLPARPQAKWRGPIDGSNYNTLQCLESAGQHLAPVAKSAKTSQTNPEFAAAHPEIANDETAFQGGYGEMALSRWPYEFSLGQPSTWADMYRLRQMNTDSSGAFQPYLKDDGTAKHLPFKPTLASLTRDIPGYEYVDNDIPMSATGAYDHMGSGSIPVFKEAPNFEYAYHQLGPDTQHMYFTYKPVLGTFELSKVDGVGAPLPGATFELYRVVDTEASPCGIAPEEADVITKVCEVRTPKDDADLTRMLASEPEGCVETKLKRVVLEGFDSEGRFITGDSGTFKPKGAPALEPGKYMVREVNAPDGYRILNEYTPFTVGIQAKKNSAGVLETAQVPVDVKVSNYAPPPVPTTPPGTTPPTTTVTPPPHRLVNTGAKSFGLGALAVVLIGVGSLFVRRRTSEM